MFHVAFYDRVMAPLILVKFCYVGHWCSINKPIFSYFWTAVVVDGDVVDFDDDDTICFCSSAYIQRSFFFVTVVALP